MMSAVQTSMPTATSSNMGSELKPAGQAQQKVKPCCVCTNEKAQRDECMLFSTASNPQEHCKDMVTKYKICMAGYGFNI